MLVFKTLIITDVKTQHWSMIVADVKTQHWKSQRNPQSLSRHHCKPQVKKHIKFKSLEMFEVKVQMINMTDIEDSMVFNPIEQLY